MSGSPRRRRLRWEEDISGQFRVTVPDAGELDQLRTRGYIGEVCMPSGTEIMYPLSEPVFAWILLLVFYRAYGYG